jgi:thiosulfate reductase cytochrome b subunit
MRILAPMYILEGLVMENFGVIQDYFGVFHGLLLYFMSILVIFFPVRDLLYICTTKNAATLAIAANHSRHCFYKHCRQND